MSQEDARSFLSQISDPALLTQAQEADNPLTFLVDAGATAGFTFSGEDLVQAVDEIPDSEPEGEAKKVAGSGPIGIVPATPIGLIPPATPIGKIIKALGLARYLQNLGGKIDPPPTQVPGTGPTS